MSVVASLRRTRGAAPALLLAALALTAAAAASAQEASGGSDAPAPLLHPMFQDHAVLQRGQPLRLYGSAPPGQQVQVEFAGRRARARADNDGRWEARLPALRAGGPHALTARAGERVQRVEDVLVGDVWLCAGQSNMELQVWRALDARAELADAGNDRIRLLTVPKAGAALPQDDFAEPVRWRPVDADAVRDFSAACYFFARELQRSIDVPMGLVSAAWGGSRIQAWTSGAALRAAGGHEDELAALRQYAADPVAAGARWGELWGQWWRGREGAAAGDEPWRADYAPGRDWRPAPPELGPWEQWGVAELAEHDGMVWYRASARLDAAQAAQDAVLVLGPVDETDMTWVNGRGVGSAYDPGGAREYPLPTGLLQAGDNTVVVNALDTYRAGGLGGPASAQYLRLADGSRVPLQGWRYRVESGSDWPPPAPWQSAAGMSTLYNGMIAPLGRYGLRGMLWYQGESNTLEAERYADQLRTLRADWRDRFGEGLPLLVVQLAGYGMPKAHPAESGWAELREAQRRVADEDTGTGLAVTIDIGDRYDLHPPNKQELGRRLARAARHVVYGERLAPSGPVPRSVRREGETVTVAFDDVDGELLAYGAEGPLGFELCGPAPETCRWAQASINGQEVVLRGAPAATRVRYGWADSPLLNMFDGAGLPAGPFETSIDE
ncbi:9-O-acetylesterase [Luteimonas sp. SJ-92]|uniref:9-O-acetylesterase n=1 Tax=Luteimonas salinisoli TaxID=2752307 RepID=A0A853J8Y4_9GAMM|nr:sialate O-acetylesterase [Luteimonas salinisoli]NZA25110.1 9-O-acetylesterase [Luteimonas salinisoli]